MGFDIPIELFITFLGATFGLALLGLIRQPQIPAMIAFAGMFMLAFSVATDNIIVSYGTSANDKTIVVTNSTTTYPYDVETFSSAGAMNNVNKGYGEFVSSTSSALYNKTIDCMDILLKKTGSPVGTATIGIYNSTDGLTKQFGTQSASSLGLSFAWKTYCLTGTDSYTIKSGDRIGIAYNNGTATDTIQLQIDTNNPFDGVITYTQVYTTSWASNTPWDMTMRLYNTVNGNTTSVVTTYDRTPDLFPFTEMPKTLFALFSAILILAGALMVYRE